MVQATKTEEKFSCPICGNEVEITKASKGELVCCGQLMEPVE